MTPTKKRGDENNSKSDQEKKGKESRLEFPQHSAEDVLTEPVKYSKAVIF